MGARAKRSAAHSPGKLSTLRLFFPPGEKLKVNRCGRPCCVSGLEAGIQSVNSQTHSVSTYHCIHILTVQVKKHIPTGLTGYGHHCNVALKQDGLGFNSQARGLAVWRLYVVSKQD